MKQITSFSTDSFEKEINKHLEGKSIYEMTVWVRDRAQHLKWFCNYNESKINATIQPFMDVSYFLYQNFRDDLDVVDDFRALCVSCVLQLEMNCR